MAGLRQATQISFVRKGIRKDVCIQRGELVIKPNREF